MMMRNVTGHDYCDCSSDSDIPLPCPEGDVFCDLIGKKRFQNKSSSPQKKKMMNQPFENNSHAG